MTVFHSITSIPTSYNGHRFHSRLEARWAIFLDSLGIPCEYEPEYFVAGNGVRFAPSFWLPDQECWMDVGRYPYRDDQMDDAATAVASETGKQVYVFCRSITPLDAREPTRNGLIHVPAAYAIRFYGDGKKSAPFMWCRCPICDRLEMKHLGQTNGECCLGENHLGVDGAGLEAAYLEACQARFSFDGESRAFRRWSDG